ncbi:30S ribosomal protein S1 [uncultured Porphyromonas sp.]|uniref:30S ribosomal protein S1 n=1 Tax=uncultured Porphyromonas sp. TaxID=159274 RepID=UPI002626EAEF|nr:30S ribosomal protein S1 [uncultured Porphyromonas sp.]
MITKYDETKPNADFDWDKYNRESDISAEQLEEEKKKYAETIPNINEDEIITGKVIAMDKREVKVDVGLRAPAVIPTSEFRYNKDLKVGDEVEVYVRKTEAKDGRPLLSHEDAMRDRAWKRIEEALESKETITGYIDKSIKGGMLVNIFGVNAFLPGSQIDVRPIRDFEEFVGKTMEFRVIKVNPDYHNVVVSHKALIEEELEAQRAEIISHLEKGQVLEGTVKNITSYGAFIDLGGVDGLVHITDLSWGRINSPEEVVEIGQKINVVVLDYDEDRKRIALGLKQLTPHPWDALEESLQVGDKVTGKVVVLTDYGAFVEVKPGVEGLVHVSEMSWTKHVHHPSDLLKVGEEIECVILSIDREERKMSLGIRQLTPDPWESIEERYPIGSKHTAEVRNFTHFGIFVTFEDGIDGLIHISDLSWTKKIKHPSDFTTIGSKIDVVVLDVDKESRRLSLGHKQCTPDPWASIEGVYAIGSVHKGKVGEISARGAVINFPDEIEGFAPLKQLTKEDGAQAETGEELDFKVLEFNRSAKRIIVSHTRTYEDAAKGISAETTTAADFSNTPSAPAEKSTLGDLDALAELREKMEDAEGQE